MTKTGIKHCPFCGSYDVVTPSERDFDEGLYYVACEYCGARGPEMLTSEEEGINAWNERSKGPLAKAMEPA